MPHLGVIADAFEPAVRDTGCSPGTKRDLARGRGIDLDLQDSRGSPHHLLERLGLEEIEVIDRTEAIAEGRR